MWIFQRTCTNSSGAGVPLQANGISFPADRWPVLFHHPAESARCWLGVSQSKKKPLLLQQEVPGVWKVEGDRGEFQLTLLSLLAEGTEGCWAAFCLCAGAVWGLLLLPLGVERPGHSVGSVQTQDTKPSVTRRTNSLRGDRVSDRGVIE